MGASSTAGDSCSIAEASTCSGALASTESASSATELSAASWASSEMGRGSAIAVPCFSNVIVASNDMVLSTGCCASKDVVASATSADVGCGASKDVVASATSTGSGWLGLALLELLCRTLTGSASAACCWAMASRSAASRAAARFSSKSSTNFFPFAKAPLKKLEALAPIEENAEAISA